MGIKIASLFAEIGADSSKLQAGLKGMDDGLANTKSGIKSVDDVLGKLIVSEKNIASSKAAQEHFDKMTQAEKDLYLQSQKIPPANEDMGISFSELNQGLELVKKGAEMVKQAYDATVGTTIRLGEETESTARLMGSTAEQASTLNGVMKIFGMGQEDLSRMLEAATRKGYEPTVAGLQKMRTEFQAIQDPVERNKYLMDTFGKSAMKVSEYFEASGVTIDQYSKAVENSGVVMHEADVEGAQQLSRSIEELNLQWTGFTNGIGKDIVPVLLDWVKTQNLETKAANDLNLAQAHGQAGMLEQKQAVLDRMKVEIQAERDTTDARWEGVAAMYAQRDAHEQLNPIIGGTTANMDDLGLADQNATKAAAEYADVQNQKQTQALVDAKDAASKLTFSMGDLTTQMLYNKAAAGLDADAALGLAEQMGLINPASKDAYEKLSDLKTQLDNGEISVSAYELAVKRLNDQLNGIHDVSATVTINQVTIDSLVKPGKKGAGSYAIGGVGGGWSMVGENGPEMVNLPTGSQVINNYETNYNLQAHYPTYQDPHSARNDMIGLTMLKNSGAAKWAR